MCSPGPVELGRDADTLGSVFNPVHHDLDHSMTSDLPQYPLQGRNSLLDLSFLSSFSGITQRDTALPLPHLQPIRETSANTFSQSGNVFQTGSNLISQGTTSTASSQSILPLGSVASVYGSAMNTATSSIFSQQPFTVFSHPTDSTSLLLHQSSQSQAPPASLPSTLPHPSNQQTAASTVQTSQPITGKQTIMLHPPVQLDHLSIQTSTNHDVQNSSGHSISTGSGKEVTSRSEEVDVHRQESSGFVPVNQDGSQNTSGSKWCNYLKPTYLFFLPLSIEIATVIQHGITIVLLCFYQVS